MFALGTMFFNLQVISQGVSSICVVLVLINLIVFSTISISVCYINCNGYNTMSDTAQGQQLEVDKGEAKAWLHGALHMAPYPQEADRSAVEPVRGNVILHLHLKLVRLGM